MNIDGAFLWKTLAEPQRLTGLNGTQLSDLIRLAWRQALAPRLGILADQAGILKDLPPIAGAALADLADEGRSSGRKLLFEMERIDSALRGADYPVLLLKGGAYIAADFSLSNGRLASDIDILVPHDALDKCEAQLAKAGWAMEAKSDYDEAYYREWMHELPPLRHQERRTLIDVHHTWVPPVARITPSPRHVFADAVQTGFETLKRPCSADLFVHAALHSFYDGDFANCLRGFVDLRGLLEDCGEDTLAYIDAVIGRAALHQAHRPVADALAMLERLDAVTFTNVQASFVRKHKRIWPIESLYRWAIDQRSLCTQAFRYEINLLARFGLYARGHWITMPPGMLARHTATRLWQRALGR